ncbi:MAG: hypothetical protein AVDCRST_MAG88-1976 [uncultured Thermomicrobiales bacterium]|jgi:hypothetical protein|uniref:Uncharacterized protein n=1 Tax=uncultured Thermomicrobiales bacterium TaxID=1645740 RepID=A0A6J4V2U2_9BACT|nr:MAG: hypothetical protein AVDCRST_MAG88-1976 [uncultured Thermomicrobiales bacterium]
MQLDFLFDVESVERETVPDAPETIVLHFGSGEFSAEVWTDAAGMAGLVGAIIEARPRAERSPTTWQPQPVAIYGLTIRPRIELAGIEVFPPGREEGEYIPYWSIVLSDEDGSQLHMALSEETALRVAALGMREMEQDGFVE